MTEKKFWHRKFYVPSHKKLWILQKKNFFCKKNFFSPPKRGPKITLFMENFWKMTKKCTELQNFWEICTENRYQEPNDDSFWFRFKKTAWSQPLAFFCNLVVIKPLKFPICLFHCGEFSWKLKNIKIFDKWW